MQIQYVADDIFYSGLLTCIIHKLSTAMPNSLHTTSVLDFFSLKTCAERSRSNLC